MKKFDTNNTTKVKCVYDEYLIISQRPCESCNKKHAYKLRSQHLHQEKNKTYEVLNTQCQYCGHKKTFTFDITDCHQDTTKQILAMIKIKEKYEDWNWDTDT
ncbi:MAG: hypothetical protein ACTSUQ_14785 [Candidatus Freyarchaeota archaeon]